MGSFGENQGDKGQLQNHGGKRQNKISKLCRFMCIVLACLASLSLKIYVQIQSYRNEGKQAYKDAHKILKLRLY